jgi:hypothetical protein
MITTTKGEDGLIFGASYPCKEANSSYLLIGDLEEMDVLGGNKSQLNEIFLLLSFSLFGIRRKKKRRGVERSGEEKAIVYMLDKISDEFEKDNFVKSNKESLFFSQSFYPFSILFLDLILNSLTLTLTATLSLSHSAYPINCNGDHFAKALNILKAK